MFISSILPIIKQKRESLGWSQEVVAHKIGVGRQHYCDFEHHKKSIATDKFDLLLNILMINPISIFNKNPINVKLIEDNERLSQEIFELNLKLLKMVAKISPEMKLDDEKTLKL